MVTGRSTGSRSRLASRWTSSTGTQATPLVTYDQDATGVKTVADNAGNEQLDDDTETAADGAAPIVTAMTKPADGTYGTGQNLDFTVTWHEAVTVNTGGGTPSISL